MIVSLYCEVEESESFIEIDEKETEKLEELINEYQDKYEEEPIGIHDFLKEKGFKFEQKTIERFLI